MMATDDKFRKFAAITTTHLFLPMWQLAERLGFESITELEMWIESWEEVYGTIVGPFFLCSVDESVIEWFSQDIVRTCQAIEFGFTHKVEEVKPTRKFEWFLAGLVACALLFSLAFALASWSL
jgi:hypothetical protein